MLRRRWAAAPSEEGCSRVRRDDVRAAVHPQDVAQGMGPRTGGGPLSRHVGRYGFPGSPQCCQAFAVVDLEVGTAQRKALKERSYVLDRVHCHLGLADRAPGDGPGRVVTHLRRQGESRADRFVGAPVGLLRRPELGTLPRRPWPAEVHRRVQAPEPGRGVRLCPGVDVPQCTRVVSLAGSADRTRFVQGNSRWNLQKRYSISWERYSVPKFWASDPELMREAFAPCGPRFPIGARRGTTLVAFRSGRDIEVLLQPCCACPGTFAHRSA